MVESERGICFGEGEFLVTTSPLPPPLVHSVNLTGEKLVLLLTYSVFILDLLAGGGGGKFPPKFEIPPKL